MPQLVLHTGGNAALLNGLATSLLEQRGLLRQQDIGLRFRGWQAPQQQWRQLASAMATRQHEPWRQALRWQQQWCRDVWLCSGGFHRCVLRESRLNHWRDWLEGQGLSLIVVVHLVAPRQESWQRFVAQTLRLKRARRQPQPAKEALLPNELYNALIETAGVRGARFVLHSGPGPTDWPALLTPQDDIRSALERPCWPQAHAPTDWRAFALSLRLLQLQPTGLSQGGSRRRWRRAIGAAAATLPPLHQAQAQQLALEGGWQPPAGAELQNSLQRFASRVWGCPWPEETSADQPQGPNSGQHALAEHRRQIDATAAQLLQQLQG